MTSIQASRRLAFCSATVMSPGSLDPAPVTPWWFTGRVGDRMRAVHTTISQEHCA
ncbi:hypothetical protein A1F99_073850 [Pyrenophora tritici-repentis]|nr:hypothetical protein A1F99_073850 [Pyrenophora tritici-repentis]